MMTRCWQCGKALVNVNGRLIFTWVNDLQGNPMRVHKTCKKDAEEAMGLKAQRTRYGRDPE